MCDLQVQSDKDAAAAATEALEAAQAKEAGLQQQRTVLDKQLLATKKREDQLLKQVRQHSMS